MKLSELNTHDAAKDARHVNDPAYASETDRLALAGAIAVAVVRYRADHNLTQTAFAQTMGWKQPAVARLERGDHQPALATLERLARAGVIRVRLDTHGTVIERWTA